jgi:hypothetical protein
MVLRLYTIPYLSTNKEVEWKSRSPTSRNSGIARVSFRDVIFQKCCAYDYRFAPNSITKSGAPDSFLKSSCVYDYRFAPDSVIKRQSSSKTKVTQTTSEAPDSFLESKVFVKRLNTAVVKIQAQARRAIQLKRYLRIIVDKAAAMKLEAAATKLQALGRGGMRRMHFQVTKLELRLLQSDGLLKTQLEAIKKDKEREMAAIYEEYKAKNEKLAKDMKDMVQKTNETITLLRKENKTLRSKNKKLRRSIAIFNNLNSRLEQLTAGFCDESVNLKKIISSCEKKNSEWGNLVDLYEGRTVQYKDLLKELSDRRICEKQVAKKTRESIVAIVSIISDESQDDELLRKVIELGESAV